MESYSMLCWSPSDGPVVCRGAPVEADLWHFTLSFTLFSWCCTTLLADRVETLQLIPERKARETGQEKEQAYASRRLCITHLNNTSFVKESRKAMVLSSENVIPLTICPEPGSNELQRFRWKAPFDERAGVEIFRRALIEQTNEAWSALQHSFSETIRIWIRSHPYQDVALLRDSEENYIAQTFSRFWYAVHTQHLEFTTLPAALRYLRATLNGLLTDTLRCHLRLRTREVSLSEPGGYQEPSVEDSMDGQSIWQSIESLLCDERERRLAYLLYYCGLKPRDIVVRCTQEFDDVKEIYRLNHNIIERLRRNRDRLRLLLGLE